MFPDFISSLHFCRRCELPVRDFQQLLLSASVFGLRVFSLLPCSGVLCNDRRSAASSYPLWMLKDELKPSNAKAEEPSSPWFSQSKHFIALYSVTVSRQAALIKVSFHLFFIMCTKRVTHTWTVQNQHYLHTIHTHTPLSRSGPDTHESSGFWWGSFLMNKTWPLLCYQQAKLQSLAESVFWNANNSSEPLRRNHVKAKTSRHGHEPLIFYKHLLSCISLNSW